MNDDEARDRLAELLETYTAGSLLHLLADMFGAAAEDARQADDLSTFDQLQTVEHALFILGLGIDAINPS